MVLEEIRELLKTIIAGGNQKVDHFIIAILFEIQVEM